MRSLAAGRMTARSTATFAWRAVAGRVPPPLVSRRGGLPKQARRLPEPATGHDGLAESYAYPNEGAWAAGVHSVICEIRGTQGKLTGSVRASGT